jgi:uncharacterized protein YcfJ
MKIRYAFLFALSALAAGHATAQVTFYEGEGFRGRAFAANRPIGDLARFGFNDRASSAVVDHGRWEVCEHAGFQGRCVVLRRGSYESLRGMGLDDRISSVRPVAQASYGVQAPPPLPAPTYAYRERPSERLYQAPVRYVRAVMGPPEQRCWVEREQVAQPAPQVNVPGAIIGGILGGVLGHQIGGGTGNTVATIGGAVGGTALGANVNRFAPATQSVRRCETVAPGGPPAYWDVTYDFRGVVHHAQMSAPPGPTVTVNGAGEPRQ